MSYHSQLRKSDRPSSGGSSIRGKARPNTTPAVIGSRREPTSIRIVRGLDGSNSRMSLLQSLVPKEGTGDGSDCDSVVIDEEVASCPISPEKPKPRNVTNSNNDHVVLRSTTSTAKNSTTNNVLSATPSVRPSSAAATLATSKPRRINLGRKELLGKGSFGMVYRAMDIDTNRILAVKEISLVAGSSNAANIDLIRKEISVMQKLDHPNIVKYLGEHWDEDTSLRIYMEYVPGGTISSILRSFGPFQERQASAFTKQVLDGLSYLHEKNIAHRDLKGENLLIDTNGCLKLADFGTAKELATEAKSVAGTAYFMAPEVIKGTGHGIEADIWSLGCCVVEMLTGKPPFSKMKNQYAIMMHIAENEEDICESIIPPSASTEVKSFLRRCLAKDATKRAKCSELLNEAWILSPPAALRESAEPKKVVEHIERLQSMDTSTCLFPPAAQDEPSNQDEKKNKSSKLQSSISKGDPATSLKAKGTFAGSSYNPMQSFSDDL